MDELRILIGEVSDNKIPLVTLLRRSKVLASQLKLDDFTKWINLELQGYTEKIPTYREVEGFLQGRNPITGWERVHFEDAKAQALYSKQRLKQSVSELEELLQDPNRINYIVRHNAEMNEIFGEITGVKTEFSLAIQRAQVKGVIDKIRNVLLDHLLELQKLNIKDPEEISKEEQEKIKELSTEIHIGNIENFQGNIGGSSNQVSGNQQEREDTIITPQEKEGFLSKFFWQVVVTFGSFQNLTQRIPYPYAKTI